MSKTEGLTRTRTAEELSKELRSVSISEFFERNRHLLGYDNPIKALLTVVKEGVDNSLDACEEAGILPDVKVEIKQLSENRFNIIIEDNGPGIVKKYIPDVFASLLYGSKFHRLRQSRGIQGIGISSAVLYAQLTTGKSAKITSKISSKNKAHYYELHIDTLKNEPEIIKEEEINWNSDHGTKVELEIEAKYQKGKQSVDEYLKQVAIINPHLKLTYINPQNETLEFPRATSELPKEPKQIKPHPYGIELGILIRMLKNTNARTLQSFLTQDFSRVSAKVAKEICEKAKLKENLKPKNISREEAEKIFNVTQQIKIMAPPTDCLSPIGEELLIKSLKKEIDADFYAAVSRPTSVYRGNPFKVEAAIAYGGNLISEDFIRLLRFANKVPLLYQQSACAITKSTITTKWNAYGLSQSKGALPTGQAIILVHIASVWVPFTSESKEAIAHYPEIIKEIKLTLQECGRKLASFIRRTVKVKEEKEKINLFEKYIPELADALSDLSKEEKISIEKNLKIILKKNISNLLNENVKDQE